LSLEKLGKVIAGFTSVGISAKSDLFEVFVMSAGSSWQIC
jgi:hypothetical protein